MSNRMVRAKRLAKTCGFWSAARWLYKQGYSFEQAYFAIFGRLPKR